jgi:hypothetical protein
MKRFGDITLSIVRGTAGVGGSAGRYLSEDSLRVMSAHGTFRPLPAESWMGGWSATKIVRQPYLKIAVLPRAITRARTLLRQDVNYQK